MRGGRSVSVLAVGLLLGSAAVESQSVYKYRGTDGLWVYSDRYPAAGAPARPAPPAGGPTGVELREVEESAGLTMVVAVNPFPAWVQIAYRIEASRNLDPAIRRAGNALLPPASETRLVSMTPIDASAGAVASFSFQYLLGHPRARHRPDGPYRLPWAAGGSRLVTQAYPDTVTHAAAADRHAIDFEMPVGTPVVAARAGTVVDLAGDYSGAGLDSTRDRDRANFVRILHDDGTLALYGHLDSGSIRVSRGEVVARGQQIAESGNTGFSTGPHLHFVVQRNRAGALESVPVTFAGSDGEVLDPRTGDRVTDRPEIATAAAL